MKKIIKSPGPDDIRNRIDREYSKQMADKI